VIHRYSASAAWEGSTGVGYDAYDRTHTVNGSEMSSDPAFRGDPAKTNPEQLLLAAAVSCQLLSFLAVAARSRLDVIAYADAAEAEMPEDDKPVRITKITLRPHVTVRGDVTPDRIRHLLEVAHRECYIANSITSEVVIDPTIEVRTAGLPA
jgi:organic hydroperoxide reductase OsmC/OhrA